MEKIEGLYINGKNKMNGKYHTSTGELNIWFSTVKIRANKYSVLTSCRT